MSAFSKCGGSFHCLSCLYLSLSSSRPHATDKLNVVKEVLQPALRGRNIFYYDRTLRYEILEIRNFMIHNLLMILEILITIMGGAGIKYA